MVEEGFSIAASAVSIVVGVVGLLGERRRERHDVRPGEESPGSRASALERLAVAAQAVALICLILAAASHLFARTALDREAYSAFDTFRAVTYIFAWIALGGAVAAFALPLLHRGRSSGWPYALFIIPAAVILMMFTYLLRESRA